ncbi:phage tail sheath subtilisin-like domain-containing protein [Streptomyces sp. NBC_00536]|uniref:phage tail sheath C-terminal domain-containing protein n=1 Tax=Streptomyces sp. NBC_00536 TaxID=2975769 RepID=UPI002E818315|nr:phage tail sheath C-terminal domain-containing protein [Streptomyces sp. NBC_00536]WUC82729.1 phage tail sheath subtilisin-like domain-containing protein [Streptomyces sp. NBC_00536]
MTPAGPRLGAPGVYRDARRPAPAPGPVRLDIAGFVGVAPRGPVDTPVAVDRWTDYLDRFGGFEGPGLLPYAVRAFFAQGGVRAHVLRVSPLPRAPHPAAEAAHALHRTRLGDGTGAGTGAGRGPEVDLRARDEGGWGGRLSVRWEFTGSEQFEAVVTGRELALPEARTPPAGSVLRLRGAGLPAAGSLFRVTGFGDAPTGPGPRGPRRRTAVLDRPPLTGPGGRTVTLTVEAEAVTLTVTVTDPDPARPRQERFAGLGLAPGHPRAAAAVLAAESLLVTPAGTWPETLLPPDGRLGSVLSRPVRPGLDRYADIGPDSFQGPGPVDLLPTGGSESAEEPGGGPLPAVGMDRMALVTEVALLAVPDLLWEHSEAPQSTELPARTAPGAVFAPCPPPPVALTSRPAAVREFLLDGATELPEILRRQQRLVALAERQRRFVALLDVPPRMPVRAVARWRAAFDSSYAAAHHPWLGVSPADDPRGAAVLVPPCGFAAGIIAERERRLGLPWGPANELAADAVTAAQRLDEADHDPLHLLGVDVFRAERDGFRLASARTLSGDPDYRQLSVRRLMTMLRLALDRQAQALAFEPHSPGLRAELRGTVVQLLRGLHRSGAFAGEREEDSFFVHCDERLNPPWSQGLGRLVAEIGVAPARPLEYLVLRIAQDGDGAVTVG